MDAFKIARGYLPDMTDDELGFVLWNLTAYPCCDEEHLRGQLKEVRNKLAQGKTIDEQVLDVEAEMSDAADHDWPTTQEIGQPMTGEDL